MSEFADKVVVITGASKGLGRAMAHGFAAAGAMVVVSSRKPEACRQVVEEITAAGGAAEAITCHVGHWEQCNHLVAAIEQRWGRIDVLVNNAGIAPVSDGLIGVGEDLFDKTISVNLKGPLRLTALAAEVMPAGGSVINISSRASLMPGPSTVVYAAAKAGLNVLTKATAAEFGARGIRVNAIVCGAFRTDSFERALASGVDESALTARIPLGRLGDPGEIVGTALWLAGSGASYLTGALITLDGGV